MIKNDDGARTIMNELIRRNECLSRENRVLREKLNHLDEMRKRDESESSRLKETFESKQIRFGPKKNTLIQTNFLQIAESLAKQSSIPIFLGL